MRTCWDKLDLAVARWKIRQLSIEDIPGAAAAALADGCETPSLALLGAMEGSNWSEIEPTVDRVFAERKRRLPTNDEAIKLIADTELHELAAGRSDPRVASYKLARLAWKTDGACWPQNEPWEDMVRFLGFDAEWEMIDEGIGDSTQLKNRVLKTAKEMLARGGVRPS